MSNDHIDPSYPIGRFQRSPEYTATERAEHIARIGLQPTRLAAVLEPLADTDFASPYRPGGWTVGQLVHHMADSHLNAFVRVKLGLTEEHPTIKPYDQDAWAALPDATSLSPHVSVALFAATHIRLHAVLEAMTPAQFARTILHPENGAMTLDQVVAMYAWHGDHHIAQLERYRDLYRAGSVDS
ncbi:YfiT family bacillithiol transferase [Gemmatimonas phototrophica]|uniref:Metal-dependent hydrolase n=1 Tax=Gemmatimonas phototrophica TaxID=1379270 RepID=A0A143BJB7_9BACT|nr:putative metal-dependent hydrolase [Gemmatimonas phototrophica]AMW04534.1 metal-dependent hydrolase [Gemmatimonas phototrophica]